MYLYNKILKNNTFKLCKYLHGKIKPSKLALYLRIKLIKGIKNLSV
jgi:hypothetical protein